MSASKQNLVLVGFMGTGKSTIGKILAKRMKRRFVDMDKMIERQEGTTIRKIFAEHGEERFRGLESALALDLSLETEKVIACGGGLVLNSANLMALGTTGIIVCLTATPKTILERLSQSKNRPLLDGEKSGRIQDLYEERKPIYDAIPLQVATDDRDMVDVAGEIETEFEAATGG